MKITRRQLRRLIREIGEKSKKPNIRDVEKIVTGLSDALHREKWPDTVVTLWDTYPNLAAHMKLVEDWFNNKSDADPGDISLQTDVPSDEEEEAWPSFSANDQQEQERQWRSESLQEEADEKREFLAGLGLELNSPVDSSRINTEVWEAHWTDASDVDFAADSAQVRLAISTAFASDSPVQTASQLYDSVNKHMYKRWRISDQW